MDEVQGFNSYENGSTEALSKNILPPHDIPAIDRQRLPFHSHGVFGW